MNITASLTGGGGAFSASTTSCNLPAGGQCDMALTFTPPSLGAFTATLVVTGPYGTQYVPLRAVSSHGYHLAAADGGIFSFGDARFAGSTGGHRLNQPVVGMASTHDGGGYWMVAADGGIFNYGDAHFFGSMGGQGLNSPIVGMAATPDGGGYWEVAADGGVFSFGDAHFYGSRGGLPVDGSVVGMAADATGHGYWLVSSQGGIFSFGDAPFFGSAGNLPLNQPVTGMAATPDGGGYWLVASDGGIFTYGDATFEGSTGGYPAGGARGGHGLDDRRRRLLAHRLRRGRVQLRGRRLLRLHGRHGPGPAHGGRGGAVLTPAGRALPLGAGSDRQPLEVVGDGDTGPGQRRRVHLLPQVREDQVRAGVGRGQGPHRLLVHVRGRDPRWGVAPVALQHQDLGLPGQLGQPVAGRDVARVAHDAGPAGCAAVPSPPPSRSNR